MVETVWFSLEAENVRSYFVSFFFTLYLVCETVMRDCVIYFVGLVFDEKNGCGLDLNF